MKVLNQKKKCDPEGFFKLVPVHWRLRTSLNEIRQQSPFLSLGSVSCGVGISFYTLLCTHKITANRHRLVHSHDIKFRGDYNLQQEVCSFWIFRPVRVSSPLLFNHFGLMFILCVNDSDNVATTKEPTANA